MYVTEGRGRGDRERGGGETREGERKEIFVFLLEKVS